MTQSCSVPGERFVTFDGIARACAEAAGAPEPHIVHYNPKDFDFGGAKAFPLRDQHFFTSIFKVAAPLLPGGATACMCGLLNKF